MFLEVPRRARRMPMCGLPEPVDELGSKQYGESGNVVPAGARRPACGSKHPHARFAWNIGYAEHAWDVAYYRAMREMSDPRFEWLECRGSWSLPGPEGKPEPLAYSHATGDPLGSAATTCRWTRSVDVCRRAAARGAGRLHGGVQSRLRHRRLLQPGQFRTRWTSCRTTSRASHIAR